MMPAPARPTGVVTSVRTRPVGTALTATSEAASTTLSVLDNVTLQDGDTILLADPETQSTTTAQVDHLVGEKTVVLTAPLATAWPADTLVTRTPVATETTAFVRLNGESEAVPCRVAHALGDAIAVGVRDEINAETVELERIDGGLQVVNILARQTVRPDIQAELVMVVAQVATKSSTTRVDYAPTTEPAPAGDQWFMTDEDGVVEAWWQGDGETWVPQVIAGVMLAVDALDGRLITGTTFRTAAAGKRIILDGPEDILWWYSGITDENPGYLDPSAYLDGGRTRPAVALRPSRGPSEPSSPVLEMQSGNLDPVAKGGAFVQLTSGDIVLLANTNRGGVGSIRHEVMGNTSTWVAKSSNVAGTAVVQLVLTPTTAVLSGAPFDFTAGAGSVGTGTFRTSVDSRILLIGPDLTMGAGNVGTGNFRESVRAESFALSNAVQAVSTADVTANTNVDRAVTGVSITIAVPATNPTTAVYRVDIDADQAIGTNAGLSVVDLVVDGAIAFASRPCRLQGPAGLRANTHRTHLLTGLSAGNHTLTLSTRTLPNGSVATVAAGTNLTVERVK